MKKIISIICTVALLLCLGVPTKAADELKIYSMADISDGSISTKLIGLDGDDFEEESDFTLDEVSSVPTSYDSRTTGCIPKIRNQGEMGACWAFATIASMEIDACKQGYSKSNTVDFSESHLVWYTYSADTNKSSPLFGEQYISDDSPYLIGGNWNRATGTLSRWSGVANESDFKFYNLEKDFDKMSNYPESGRYNTDSGVILKDAEVFSAANDVKNWIMTHGSCTASFYWNAKNYNSQNKAYYSLGSVPNHMITIVGWDDNFSKSNFNSTPSKDGAWLVRDSNGDYMDNDGYYWLSYRDGSLQDFAGFSAQSASNYDNNYTYNAVGFSSAASCTSGSTVANIFTATGKQNLKAVSFYTITKNTSATIRIYTGFSGSNVTSGTCVNEKKVTISNRGYHTVELDKANVLAKGTKFAVAITYSVSSGTVEIPVEQLNKTVSGVKYTSQSGQSVALLNNDDTWTDAVDYSVGNFFIQAFTTDNDDPHIDPPAVESSVSIRNMEKFNDVTFSYRSSIVFYADCVNANNVKWNVDGADYAVNADSSVTVNEAKGNFTIYCTATGSNGQELTSETETIKVDSGLLSRIIAFIEWVFGILPIYYQ